MHNDRVQGINLIKNRNQSALIIRHKKLGVCVNVCVYLHSDEYPPSLRLHHSPLQLSSQNLPYDCLMFELAYNTELQQK